MVLLIREADEHKTIHTKVSCLVYALSLLCVCGLIRPSGYVLFSSCPSLFVSLHPKRTGLELPSHVVGETGYLPLLVSDAYLYSRLVPGP